MDEQKLNLSKTNFLRVWCCARSFFVASSMFWEYLVNNYSKKYIYPLSERYGV